LKSVSIITEKKTFFLEKGFVTLNTCYQIFEELA